VNKSDFSVGVSYTLHTDKENYLRKTFCFEVLFTSTPITTRSTTWLLNLEIPFSEASLETNLITCELQVHKFHHNFQLNKKLDVLFNLDTKFSDRS